MEYYWIWADISHPKHLKNGSWTCKNKGYVEMIGFCLGLYSAVWMVSHFMGIPPSTSQHTWQKVLACIRANWILLLLFRLDFQETSNPAQSCSWGSWDVFLELRRVGSWGSWQILWSWSLGLQCAAQQIWLSGIQKSSRFIKIHFRKVSSLVYNVVRVISWFVHPIHYSCKLQVS